MNMMEIARSPLINLDSKAINDDPGPFCMSYEFALGPLIRSIQEFGLINPPILVRGGEGMVDHRQCGGKSQEEKKEKVCPSQMERWKAGQCGDKVFQTEGIVQHRRDH